jgi:hypothetical protein
MDVIMVAINVIKFRFLLAELLWIRSPFGGIRETAPKEAIDVEQI